jgi:hypothetical protein
MKNLIKYLIVTCSICKRRYKILYRPILGLCICPKCLKENELPRKYYNTKPPSKRKLWAMQRNWLIKRLLGAISIFSDSTNLFIHTLLPDEAEEHFLIAKIRYDLRRLVNKIQESKYKEQ